MTHRILRHVSDSTESDFFFLSQIPMCVFLSQIVQPHLSIADIANLEIALSNKRYRYAIQSYLPLSSKFEYEKKINVLDPVFVDIISMNIIVLKTIPQAQWLIDRNVLCSNLKVVGNISFYLEKYISAMTSSKRFSETPLLSLSIQQSNFFDLSKYFSKLNHLSLQHHDAVDALMTITLPQLESISIAISKVYGKKFHHFLQNCLSLKSINIITTKMLTAYVLKQISSSCKGSLKSIGIACCSPILTMSLDEQDEFLTSFSTICFNNPIETIRLLGYNEVDSQFMKEILERSPNLTSLHVSTCLGVSDNGLERWPIYCPKITSIEISSCPFVTNKGLQCIFSALTKLTHFQSILCECINDEKLLLLTTLCPNLVSINLVFARNQITPDGFKAISENCKNLEQLAVVNAENFHESTLALILSGCPNLRLVTLVNCFLKQIRQELLQEFYKVKILIKRANGTS